MSDEQPVVARLKRVRESVSMQKGQSEAAAVAISQFLHVVHGLRGHVPEEQIHGIAATLTIAALDMKIPQTHLSPR